MKTALDAFVASLIRTLTPLVVGWVISLAVTLNMPLDPEFEIALATLITVAFQGVYYVLVRLGERFVSPKLGWLIGTAQQPVAYKPADPAGK